MARPNTLGERFAFTVVVTPEMVSRLNRLAESRGQKRSTFVRWLLKDGMDRQERIERIALALDEAAS